MISDTLKTTISSFFLNRLEPLNSVEFVRFEYDNEQEYVAGFGCFEDPEDPVNVIFSIPINAYHIFFTITEGNAQRIAQDLSAIQQYCENVSEICVGHSVPTENKYLLENGYVGYVFISASQFHECLEKAVELNGKQYKGIGAIPVNTMELKIKRESGIEALFDYWNENGKDRLAFNKN